MAAAGSSDTGTPILPGTNLHTGAGYVLIEPLCYLRGTHILTPTGAIFVEDLNIGDLVVTRFAGIQPVKWIGRQSYDSRFIQTDRSRLPVCVHAGALGDHLPAYDLYISPGHSMLVDGQLVLATFLVNGVTVTQDWSPANIDYFQIELETHDCVIAEGTWSETYADAPGLREQFHNAAEFAALYPDHAPPDELSLCAPRPERGPKLDAVLRPVVARAAATLTTRPVAWLHRSHRGPMDHRGLGKRHRSSGVARAAGNFAGRPGDHHRAGVRLPRRSGKGRDRPGPLRVLPEIAGPLAAGNARLVTHQARVRPRRDPRAPGRIAAIETAQETPPVSRFTTGRLTRRKFRMQNGIHFISGLPRSGSTLLAALLLTQNPALHAGITSPVGSLVTSPCCAASARATRPR